MRKQDTGVGEDHTLSESFLSCSSTGCDTLALFHPLLFLSDPLESYITGQDVGLPCMNDYRTSIN